MLARRHPGCVFRDCVTACCPGSAGDSAVAGQGSGNRTLDSRRKRGRLHPSGDRTIANVSDPSVTVFLPSPALATGAAVVVAPGGALRALAWDSEGIKVAQWLNSKGIAALVLKYRTLQSSPGGNRGRGGAPQGFANAGAARVELEIRNANANPEPGDAALAEVLRMGIADAQQALSLARRNAAEWRIDPTRVGIMGFSAGGGVAVGTVLAERSDPSPDFLVSVYGPALQDVIVPAHAPPLVHCRRLHTLQCDQRLSGTVRGVESGGQTRRNPCLRSGQWRVCYVSPRTPCGYVERAPLRLVVGAEDCSFAMN